MDTDCARLGEALKAARLALRPKLTQEEVAVALGVSRATVQNIEQGKPFKRVSPTIRAFAELVGWTPDSPERILAGGDPIRGNPVDAENSRRSSVEGLPMTVQDELERDGAVVETAVIQLPDGTSVTVVVKGASKNPTPEERQRHLRAWRRMQPMLHELSYPTDRDSA
ncbi:helix-turn-helix domain-containing protein [Streptomyces sp. NBC_01264]|uniref:helix-turn-helix domain-containing protein n=1 Tax=Streptomyces sp. NBC_01264 TaxID=2903804 RepID=UPI00224DEEFC|nr:helix-turn-helix transcriptional regulator [Streptomyces sp. NBC_01264]MCX4778107.1 helix-turn-helix domain-containing protein [Streptomyces sp. NBC_01264]